ncbi:MAG: hypothetical protein ABSG91_04995 [Syntrophobacteraceae bacterium]
MAHGAQRSLDPANKVQLCFKLPARGIFNLCSVLIPQSSALPQSADRGIFDPEIHPGILKAAIEMA